MAYLYNSYDIYIINNLNNVSDLKYRYWYL